MQSFGCAPLEITNMDLFPKMQGEPAPTQLDDHSWTVDSADVFARSGPNGMNRFAPWGPERTKEIANASADENK